MPNSTVLINAICDYCGKDKKIEYRNYLKSTKNNTEKYSCNLCKQQKNQEYYFLKIRNKQFEKIKNIVENQGYKIISMIDDYKNAKSKLKTFCSIHGENLILSETILRGGCSCKQCTSERIIKGLTFSSEYVKEMIENKNNNVLLNSEEYVNEFTKNLRIICGCCGNEFITSFQLFKISNSGKCPKCGRNDYIPYNKYTHEDIIRISNEKEIFIENPNDYIDVNRKNLNVICKKCFNQYITSLRLIIISETGGCSICGQNIINQKLKLTCSEVKEIIDSVGNNTLLNPDDYVGSNINNLVILCGECGQKTFKTSLNSYKFNNKTRCSVCTQKTSSGELKIQEILNKYNIAYISEYRFKDCKDKVSLPFDFYLPYYNKCIEFDSQGHYKNIYGEEQFKKQQKHDKIKNKYCFDKNIDLLRIPYWESNNMEQLILNFINQKK